MFLKGETDVYPRLHHSWNSRRRFLGGKNAAIIFADADLDKAVTGTMQSVFSNCGQVCLGTERVYVERPLFDTFVAALKKGAFDFDCQRGGSRPH